MSEFRRCAWADSHPLLRDYHDQDYGVPKRGDSELLELLLLEALRRLYRAHPRAP